MKENISKHESKLAVCFDQRCMVRVESTFIKSVFVKVSVLNLVKKPVLSI